LTTYILTPKEAKEDLVKILDEHAKDGEHMVLLAFDLAGDFRAPTKRKNYYQIGFGVAECFKKPGDLHNILDAKMFAVIIVKKDLVSNNIIDKLLKKEGGEK